MARKRYKQSWKTAYGKDSLPSEYILLQVVDLRQFPEIVFEFNKLGYIPELHLVSLKYHKPRFIVFRQQRSNSNRFHPAPVVLGEKAPYLKSRGKK